jgi:HAD superfamily hydrolase (TIGR01509 family)
MTTPSAIVFDLGKVLLDFDYAIAARKIAELGKLSPDAIKRFIDSSPLLFRYETGLLTTNEFFAEMCRGTGYCGGFDQFNQCFGDIFAPIDPMVEMHAALRQKGFPTYIFSNTNEIAIRHIRRNFPFFARFDGYVLSYEHGAMKPDAKIYEVVERQTGKRGAEILYLDDRLENVEAGAARGWQVILQQSPEQTRAAFEKLGLLNGETAVD